MEKRQNFVFVTGGVLSGIGKGTTASSIGLLLRSYGFRVSAVKIDPYLNTHAGNMSPLEHGEVYVLDDGTECDLDLGNYERFLDIVLGRSNSITTGQIYEQVIKNEQQGIYLGKTVQIVPHITDEITKRIIEAGQMKVTDINGVIGIPEIVIVELGGTVGDWESEPFFNTLSHFPKPCCFIHVGLLVDNNKELKTKPLQHSVEALFSRGVIPDILCVRTTWDIQDVPETIVKKIARSCHVKNEKAVILSGKVDNIYYVPKMLHEQGICEIICAKLGLLWRGTLRPNFDSYNKILDHFTELPVAPTRIGIVAKYASKGTSDTYLSLERALDHASFFTNTNLKFEYIDAEYCDENIDAFDGIIIPGGFGERGIGGKIKAIAKMRQTKTPLFGLCLGMQLMAIEECRIDQPHPEHFNGIEFDSECDHPVTRYVDATTKEMRLGIKTVRIEPGTLAYKAYIEMGVGTNTEDGCIIVQERHRHRFQVINDIIYSISRDAELKYSGWSGDSEIPEIMETTVDGWWAIGTQFHPEYISRNNRPHPLFVEFIKQSKKRAKNFKWDREYINVGC
jgi:CTP synthase